MEEYEQSPVWQGERRDGVSADTSGFGWVPSPEKAAVRGLRNVVAAAEAPAAATTTPGSNAAGRLGVAAAQSSRSANAERDLRSCSSHQTTKSQNGQ